jgi:hypothetical protein
MNKLALLILTFIPLLGFSECRTTINIQYKTNYGWSKNYTLQASYLTGEEMLNKFPYKQFDLGSVYVLIYWSSGGNSRIKLNQLTTVEASFDCYMLDNIGESSFYGYDQSNKFWKLKNSGTTNDVYLKSRKYGGYIPPYDVKDIDNTMSIIENKINRQRINQLSESLKLKTEFKEVLEKYDKKYESFKTFLETNLNGFLAQKHYLNKLEKEFSIAYIKTRLKDIKTSYQLINFISNLEDLIDEDFDRVIEI